MSSGREVKASGSVEIETIEASHKKEMRKIQSCYSNCKHIPISSCGSTDCPDIIAFTI